MEKHSGIIDTVLLLDNYGEESRMLYLSFRRAGFDGPVIVLMDDGFLPDDVISIYQYFCGDYTENSDVPGRARYFNQINIPDYWEISGNNTGGKIHNLNKERGRIFYAEPLHKRLVKTVDWMDESGTVRASDHYNKYGALYAKTAFNKKGQKFCKSYFDSDGKEVLMENYVTSDIILNRDGKVFLYKNKTQLALKLLEEIGAMNSRLFYNSLSTPLFVSERMPDTRTEDVLFWQEDERNDIPGNMQMIFDGKSKRTKNIYVQKKDSYVKLISLGAPADLVKPLGFAYEFDKENGYENNALICTNSDMIERCVEIIELLPDMHFHIAAITEMSSKLLSLSKYENVTLYPAAKTKHIEKLFDICDFYLDINHGNEIMSAVKTAFLHNHLIAGFSKTTHNKRYIAAEHIFDDYQALVDFLKSVMNDTLKISKHIRLQKDAAMAENPSEYAKLLNNSFL